MEKENKGHVWNMNLCSYQIYWIFKFLTFHLWGVFLCINVSLKFQHKMFDVSAFH